jgi:hypothetical protein
MKKQLGAHYKFSNVGSNRRSALYEESWVSGFHSEILAASFHRLLGMM